MSNPKRIRRTNRMESSYRDCRDRLISLWIETERNGDPICNASDKSRAMIANAGPFTPALSWDLHTCHDTLRNRAVRLSKWALYLDGVKTTTDEISERYRDAKVGSAEYEARFDAYKRLCGRHEWPNGRPFYDSNDPTSLR